MAHPYWQPAVDAALADCLPDLPPTEPEEDYSFIGCPVLGHDCYELRCQSKCRMSAFSWAEMDADKERNA